MKYINTARGLLIIHFNIFLPTLFSAFSGLNLVLVQSHGSAISVGIHLFPPAPPPYIHRVGRTGRRGLPGTAILLLHPLERPFIAQLTGLPGRSQAVGPGGTPSLSSPAVFVGAWVGFGPRYFFCPRR